ncbi:LysR family transcriptional regulator [Roseibium sp.]|uniref:LysR family transcriptional regulator n=1 Tax=Roseibium sp. TaxID=1936156 RepID=UPI003BAFD630
MTFDQLVCLNAIVEHGTFRAAADHLNKAQSAISHSVKKLEGELGFALLSRASYRPVLTEKGEVFHRYSLRVLQHVQELKTIGRTLNSEQEAEVLLNVTTTYPLKPVLGLIGDMTAAYAATHIRLSRDNMGGSLEKLLSGEAQIAISTLHDAPQDRVEAVPLESVTILPVCSPTFLPLRETDVRSDVEMQSHVQVVVSDSSTANKQNRGLLPGSLRWTVSDFAAKREILLAGMGWGGMPDHMVRDDLENGDLIALRVESYAPVEIAHYAMRLRESAKGVVAQAIWQRLVNPAAGPGQ